MLGAAHHLVGLHQVPARDLDLGGHVVLLGVAPALPDVLVGGLDGVEGQVARVGARHLERQQGLGLAPHGQQPDIVGQAVELALAEAVEGRHGREVGAVLQDVDQVVPARPLAIVDGDPLEFPESIVPGPRLEELGRRTVAPALVAVAVQALGAVHLGGLPQGRVPVLEERCGGLAPGGLVTEPGDPDVVHGEGLVGADRDGRLALLAARRPGVQGSEVPLPLGPEVLRVERLGDLREAPGSDQLELPLEAAESVVLDDGIELLVGELDVAGEVGVLLGVVHVRGDEVPRVLRGPEQGRQGARDLGLRGAQAGVVEDDLVLQRESPGEVGVAGVVVAGGDDHRQGACGGQGGTAGNDPLVALDSHGCRG